MLHYWPTSAAVVVAPVRRVRPVVADGRADSTGSVGMWKVVVAVLRSGKLWSESRADRRAVNSKPLPLDKVYNSWPDTLSNSASVHASSVNMENSDERRRPQQQQLQQLRRQLADVAVVDAVAAAPADAGWWARRCVRPADSERVSSRRQ